MYSAKAWVTLVWLFFHHDSWLFGTIEVLICQDHFPPEEASGLTLKREAKCRVTWDVGFADYQAASNTCIIPYLSIGQFPICHMSHYRRPPTSNIWTLGCPMIFLLVHCQKYRRSVTGVRIPKTGKKSPENIGKPRLKLGKCCSTQAQFLEHLAAKHGRALAAPGRRLIVIVGIWCESFQVNPSAM